VFLHGGVCPLRSFCIAAMPSSPFLGGVNVPCA